MFWRQYLPWVTVLFNFSDFAWEVPSSALEYYHVKEGTGDIFRTVHNLCFFKYGITWLENFLRDKKKKKKFIRKGKKDQKKESAVPI